MSSPNSTLPNRIRCSDTIHDAFTLLDALADASHDDCYGQFFLIGTVQDKLRQARAEFGEADSEK